MALSTAATMALALETAYVSIIAGKLANYSIGGDSYGRHNINDLFAQVKYWRRQAAIESNGGNVFLADLSQPDNQI